MELLIMNTVNINSDIFRKYDIRGIVSTDITPDIARTIGKAVGTYLHVPENMRMVVGMDNRPSSEQLKSSLISGLNSTGCNVTDIGLCTSPMMYYSVIEGNYTGGIIVTASHNPKEYNGFKIVSFGAAPVADEEISEIKEIALNGTYVSGSGINYSDDVSSKYLNRISSVINLQRPLKVVIDAGNAIAGKFAPILFRRLGCEVVELYCDLDGNFPNHLPNPEHEANLIDLKHKVKETKADIGIGFDGDGDRVGIIDENGVYRESDYSIILLARDFLKRYPGETVLIDVKASLNVINDIKRHGGKPLLYKTGHSLIKKKMQSDNIKLGGELSGHLYVFENYFPFDDALFAASRILEIISKHSIPYHEHFTDLSKLYSTPIIDIPCRDSKKFSVINSVVKIFTEKYEVNNIDGARITFPDGWSIIRASNTTPTLTFRVEAESPEGVESIKKEVYGVLEKFPDVQLDKRSSH